MNFYEAQRLRNSLADSAFFVENLIYGVVRWYNVERLYGKLDVNGPEVFFHRNQGRSFSRLDKKYRLDRWTGCQRDPKVQDGILFVLTHGSQGPRAEYWGYRSDLQQLIANEAKQEAERLRCNPKFTAWEQREHRDGRKEKARLIFAGTRNSFLISYPLGQSYDPLITTPMNAAGYRYVRLFERETSEGWKRCEDPRKIKLPMTLAQAAALLASADFWQLVDHTFGDVEFGWNLKGQPIASGYYGREGYDLTVHETAVHSVTMFGGKQAEELYDAGGATRSYEQNDAGDPKWFDLPDDLEY